MKHLISVMAGLACSALIIPVFAADFWVTKEYTAWSEKECQKLLTKSPWAFSVNFVKVSNIGLIDVGGHGEREQRVTFRFRFVSAKPVKMAFAQLEMLQKPEDSGLADRMNAIVNSAGELEDRIALQLEFSVDPPGDSAVRDIHSFLLNAKLADFEQDTYLAASSKAMVRIVEYLAPNPNRTKPVFVFPRVNEKSEPFSPETRSGSPSGVRLPGTRSTSESRQTRCVSTGASSSDRYKYARPGIEEKCHAQGTCL
jgi:hypothetical protein